MPTSRRQGIVNMNIKTLEGTDQRLILKAFNESFSDYFTPFELTEEQLTAKMAADKTKSTGDQYTHILSLLRIEF